MGMVAAEVDGVAHGGPARGARQLTRARVVPRTWGAAPVILGGGR